MPPIRRTQLLGANDEMVLRIKPFRDALENGNSGKEERSDPPGYCAPFRLSIPGSEDSSGPQRMNANVALAMRVTLARNHHKSDPNPA